MHTETAVLPRSAAWLPVAVLYLAGMLQGLTLVSFPASSAVLKAMHGFSDAQYGAIFLPQVALAVVGSLAGGGFAGRLGLKTLLWIALLTNVASQLFLAGSVALPPQAAYAAVLTGTACLGLGFGLSGAPLNGYPPIFFPQRRDTALVALHTALGLGLAVGPLVASPFIMAQNWVAFPLLLAGLAGLLALAALTGRFPADGTQAQEKPSVERLMGDPLPMAGTLPHNVDPHPVRTRTFWLFAAVCVLYAFAEGTFSNWAVLYLQDVKHLPETVAASALSVFWAAIVGGRCCPMRRVPSSASPYSPWQVLPVPPSSP